MNHNFERGRRDVMPRNGRHRGIAHGAEELRFQDRRTGGEDSPMSEEYLTVDNKRHIRPGSTIQQAAEMVPDVGPRHGERAVVDDHDGAHNRDVPIRHIIFL